MVRNQCLFIVTISTFTQCPPFAVSSLRGANEVRCKTQRVQAPDVCASTQKRSFNLLSDDAESLMRKHRGELKLSACSDRCFASLTCWLSIELELVLSKLVLSVTAVPTANSATADTIPTVKVLMLHVRARTCSNFASPSCFFPERFHAREVCDWQQQTRDGHRAHS
jgi:hypothetical protein